MSRKQLMSEGSPGEKTGPFIVLDFGLQESDLLSRGVIDFGTSLENILLFVCATITRVQTCADFSSMQATPHY